VEATIRTLLSMTRANADAAFVAERELVSAAVEGNGLAFRKLVEPHLPMLHRIAARVGGRRDLAEDAVQETLALAYQRLGSYRHDVPFKAYLAAIASRQAHTLARSERRRGKREEVAEGPTRPASPEQQLEGATAARRVREALMAMPDKRRQAALLRLDAGLSYKEIAAALDSSEGSARVLVHKALKELKERLDDLLETNHE
jgi:RNA polymerase sigma-70 factor, ECF subfamily